MLSLVEITRDPPERLERLIQQSASSRIDSNRIGVTMENHRIEIEPIRPNDRSVVNLNLGEERRILQRFENGAPKLTRGINLSDQVVIKRKAQSVRRKNVSVDDTRYLVELLRGNKSTVPGRCLSSWAKRVLPQERWALPGRWVEVPMKHIGIQVDAVRPDNCSCGLIHRDLFEDLRNSQLVQDSASKHRIEVELPHKTVREGNPQSKLPERAHLNDSRQRSHSRHSTEVARSGEGVPAPGLGPNPP